MAESLLNFQESYLINLFKIIKCGNFNETLFSAKKNEILRINKICESLFTSDYIIQLIDNQTDNLCPHYPPLIFIPYPRIATDIDTRSSIVKSNNILMQNIYKSTQARCRNRFVVPTMNYGNKFVCRSSTLSGTFEIYGRQYFGSVFGAGSETSGGGKDGFDKIRGDDKILLDNLKVKYIFDLMLENKKMMFGLPMSSSEKIDRHNRYYEFNIIILPYPGCEFFNEWRKSNYKMSGLVFQWDHHEITSKLLVQMSFIPLMTSSIDWKDYTKWDLTELTSNYLKLILGIMIEDNYSILIHCISGWDRTPLFISLIRCLLWSDGLLHQSLSASQMLYLTLAYDWYLFGHQTKSRLKSGEEILKFTFSYLQYASRDLTTSVIYAYRGRDKLFDSDNDMLLTDEESLNLKLFQRKEKLEEIASLFDNLYDQELCHIVNKSSTKGTKSLVYSASSIVNGLLSPFNNTDSSTSK